MQEFNDVSLQYIVQGEFTRRQFLKNSLVFVGYLASSQLDINTPKLLPEAVLKPSLETLQIGPLSLFIDPTIPQDQQTGIANQVAGWMNKAYRYYPTLNQQGLHNTSFFVYNSGQELLNVMPSDSPYRVLSASQLDSALGFGMDSEAYFHITMSSPQDVRFVAEWAHLLQYMLNKNGAQYWTPAWFKEGLAITTAYDIAFGNLNNWRVTTDSSNVSTASSELGANPDISTYNDNHTQWQGRDVGVHSLSNLAVEYIASLSPTGTVDIGYQILDQVYNSGTGFYQALTNLTGLGEQDFYNSFRAWYRSKL